MKIVDTTEGAPAQSPKEKMDSVMDEAMEALSKAEEQVDTKDTDDTKDLEPLEDLDSADVDKRVSESSILSSVGSVNGDRFTDVVDDNKPTRKVNITKEEKDRFLESVVSGTRYISEASIFGGRIRVKFRSRSAVESEAIDSFLRYRASHKVITNGVSFADTMRFCMLAAGVEMLNGEAFPTLTEIAGDRAGLFYHETETGEEEPKWVWLYEKWCSRPESIVAAIVSKYFEFEAKYWAMIEKASDENFWNPDGSTAE